MQVLVRSVLYTHDATFSEELVLHSWASFSEEFLLHSSTWF